MKANSASRNSRTKRIFAGLLAVWMSGVVFLFCCGAPKVQAAAQMESCPLAEKNHCNKSSGDKSSKMRTPFDSRLFKTIIKRSIAAASSRQFSIK